MDMQHQGRNTSGLLHSVSRLALFATPALIAAALLINAALPTIAHSQINGRVTGAPKMASAPHISEKPRLPKAPTQVAMPVPPPMKIFPGLEESLVATGPVTAQEGQDLDKALAAFHDAPAKAGPQGDYADYAKPLLAFIDAHPKSNWNSALQLNLGLGYYHAGYFSRAFDAFQKSWELGRDATNPQARLLVDRAVGELAKMHARVGHEKELTALLKDIGNRPIGGPATELIQGAREGLWAFHHNAGEAYLCGPRALENLLKNLNATPKQIQVAHDARSGSHGFTLAQVAQLADKAKIRYTLIHRDPGQPIPVPSVIHWKVHHYAAITGTQDGKYLVADPTFGSGSGGAFTARALDEESSGYFLVPVSSPSPRKPGWRTIRAASPEAKSIYGMGTTSNSDNAVMPCDPMCVADSHKMVVSLTLQDTPVGYKPQKGSTPIYTSLTYNQRDNDQPAVFGFSNVGPKWAFSWMSYMQDDPANVGVSVARIARGGGAYEYPNGDFYTAGGIPGRTINGEYPDLSETWRFPVTGTATSYEHRLPDGSKEVFSLSDGATTYPRKLFLTSLVDPQGNITTLNYDTSFRLTSVVDPMGRSTTFTYGLPTSPLLITQITDPFGRASQLTYDASGRLASITDPAGITSSFTYSGSEPSFIAQMTTPYGTSKFSDTVNPNDFPETNTRSLTMSDPLGNTTFAYFYQNSAITPASDPAATIPSGFLTDNGLLQWRNTYYWDEHAFALGVTTDAFGNVISQDFTKATLFHWLHDNNNVSLTGRGLGSTKKPLEHRLWFNYLSQGVGYSQGALGKPLATGRVLDDGSTQTFQVSYNTAGAIAGQLAAFRDQVGRYTQINYAPNQVDINSVARNKLNPASLCSGCWWTLASFTWNTIHRPLTMTDAAGKVWTYTWNTAGQITSVKDPNAGTTTYNYDSVGRLSNIVNANSVTQAVYTYDSADRIATYTDSEGYVLSYAYDNLDRITSITYPDGTTDLYDYTFQSGPFMGTASLELRRHTDRLGRVTTFGYDAARRLISVTEPTSGAATRTTSYDYYENGVLKDIIDANGNVTHWDIDIQSRPTKKTYATGTGIAQSETYTYENTTSRLHSITDANGQTRTFSYGKDDRITGIAYTGAINPTPNVTFAWDNIFERISSMTDGLGTTSFTYGATGALGGLKLASIDGPFANDVISLTYDNLSRLAGRTITGGSETFGYDALSRLTSHGTPLGSFTYGYLGQTGQTTSRSVTNGTVTVSTNWGYDTNANDRRLISIANSGVTRSYTLGYGSPVNPYDIMSIIDTAASGHPFASQSHGYTYDSVDRLLTATSTVPGNYTYGYDNLDNATSVTDPAFGSTSPTYNGLNQVQTFNANTYSYDNNGNTTSDGLTKNYKWDAENRLIEIDYIGSTAKSQFQYDGLGHRTVDVETDAVGNVTTQRFLWCGDRICQVRDGSDTVQRRDLIEGEYNNSVGQKLVYVQDHLGSVRDVLDGTTATLLQSYDYSPYGNIVQSSGSTSLNYRYAGLFFHPASNLNLATYRAFDGITGRFQNLDPIREAGGPNPYTYGGASPIRNVDPQGLLGGEATCEFPWNPVCVISVGQDIWSVYKGISFAMSANQNLTKNAEREADYLAYKRLCNQSPPPGLDKCEEAKWRLNRNKSCLQAREDFTNKWYGGSYDDSHAGQMAQTQSSIANAEADVKRYCKCPKP